MLNINSCLCFELIILIIWKLPSSSTIRVVVVVVMWLCVFFFFLICIDKKHRFERVLGLDEPRQEWTSRCDHLPPARRQPDLSIHEEWRDKEDRTVLERTRSRRAHTHGKMRHESAVAVATAQSNMGLRLERTNERTKKNGLSYLFILCCCFDLLLYTFEFFVVDGIVPK